MCLEMMPSYLSRVFGARSACPASQSSAHAATVMLDRRGSTKTPRRLLDSTSTRKASASSFRLNVWDLSAPEGSWYLARHLPGPRFSTNPMITSPVLAAAVGVRQPGVVQPSHDRAHSRRLALILASVMWASENSFTMAAAVSRKRGGSITDGCSGQAILTAAGML